jgi:hypothetical protein
MYSSVAYLLITVLFVVSDLFFAFGDGWLMNEMSLKATLS